MRITDTWLKSKPIKMSPGELLDVTETGRRGFIVRLVGGGSTTFRFRYKRAGKTRHMALGSYPAVSLEEAHAAHHAALMLLKQGHDPIDHAAAQKEAAEAKAQAESGTVAAMIDQFVHRRLRGERWDGTAWVRDERSNTRTRKRPDAAAQLLKANITDHLGTMRAVDLTKKVIIDRLEAIVDRGRPVTANRVAALLRQCLDYGVLKDLIPANPMPRMEPPGGEESSRERDLSDAEIKIVWDKLPECEMSERVRLALKFLLLTGQRRGETSLARWTDIDLKENTWTIPAEIAKNGREHVVPLSTLALSILAALKALKRDDEPDSPYLFPTHHTKVKEGAPMTERAITRAVRENAEIFGIPHWTPHDFRRTVRTRLSELKVKGEVSEAILNHKKPGMAGVYDKYGFLKEKRAALQKWATHVSKVIAS